jgi:hypothetical protein
MNSRVSSTQKKKLFISEKLEKILKRQQEAIDDDLRQKIIYEEARTRMIVRTRIEKRQREEDLEKRKLGDVPPSTWECEELDVHAIFSPERRCGMYMKRKKIDEVVTDCFCANQKHFFVGLNKYKPERTKVSWWAFPLHDLNTNNLVPRPDDMFYGLCGGTKEIPGTRKIKSFYVPLQDIGLKRWYFDTKKNCYKFKDKYNSLGTVQSFEYQISVKKRVDDLKIIELDLEELREKLSFIYQYEKGRWTHDEDSLDEDAVELFRSIVREKKKRYFKMPHPNTLPEEEQTEDYKFNYALLTVFFENLHKGIDSGMMSFISFDENKKAVIDYQELFNFFKNSTLKHLHDPRNFPENYFEKFEKKIKNAS